MNKIRRRFIVDPKLQYSLMTALLAVFMLASGTFYVTMSFALLEVHATVGALQLPQEHQVFSDLQRIENAAMVAFTVTFIGFAILLAWGGLYLARKIAGPIIALRLHLERVTNGETDADLPFRKDDYFTALQTAFNQHMGAYRRKLTPL